MGCWESWQNGAWIFHRSFPLRGRFWSCDCYFRTFLPGHAQHRAHFFFLGVVHWLAEYILEQMLFPKWRSWSWKCKWKWGHGKSWELLECGESKAIYRCSCWQQPQNGSLRNSDGVITGSNNWQGRTDINSSRFGLAVLKNTLGSSALLKINHGLWF